MGIGSRYILLSFIAQKQQQMTLLPLTVKLRFNRNFLFLLIKRNKKSSLSSVEGKLFSV
jgi:hypothetical protein